MKILTVINQYDPVLSGAENVAKFIVEHTNDENFTNDVLTIASERVVKLAGRSLPFKETKDNLYSIYRFKLARLFGKEKNGAFFQYVNLIKYIYYILKIGRKYDIIHAHTFYFPAAASIIAGKILNKPVIVTGHNRLSILKKEVEETSLPGFCLSLLKYSNCYVSISRKIFDEASEICDIPGSKNILIHNGINTDIFCPCHERSKLELRLKLNLPANKTIIIYHGRLNNHAKNIQTLLDVFSDLVKDFPHIFLVLVGEGEDKENYMKFCEKNGINESVFFTGYIKNTYEYLKAADIYCLPSYYEGLSLALIEAMASGLISVASDIPGNNEVIQDGTNGFLFNPYSKEALRNILIKILNSNDSELSNIRHFARTRADKEFSLKNMIEAYKKIYLSIIEGSK